MQLGTAVLGYRVAAAAQRERSAQAAECRRGWHPWCDSGFGGPRLAFAAPCPSSRRLRPVPALVAAMMHRVWRCMAVRRWGAVDFGGPRRWSMSCGRGGCGLRASVARAMCSVRAALLRGALRGADGVHA
ncbi:hypothetical protein CKO31_14345 [Thiohalocapsa halophila]|uniref:Uncharacterized protein n=1 Tax=Thiohalocapsa halophila TaxID=69359 RepID=A0ABS1CJ01_9GAMM|nr:hypothetical protein [Thiohalocapsa halophila]